MDRRENDRIAGRLREAADRLESRGESRYRIAAYRRAATGMERSSRCVRELYERYGLRGLEEVPGVGPAIADAIAEMLTTGHWRYLERLSTERVVSYEDEEGVARYCTVLQYHAAKPVHGRDAIAALLSRK